MVRLANCDRPFLSSFSRDTHFAGSKKNAQVIPFSEYLTPTDIKELNLRTPRPVVLTE